MELVGNQYKIRLTSKFGEVSEIRNYRPHTGIDLAIPEATELKSIVSGTIERVVSEGANPLGNGIIIRGEDGRAYIYGHLSKVDVVEGQIIKEGQHLGLSGSTGNSTAPHLHFGVQEPSGEFVNPEPLADVVADLTGGGGNFILDKYNQFADWAIGKQVDLVFEPLRQTMHDILLNMWDWFIISLPDIMGYTTILAGIVIILGAMIGRGGMIKPLGAWGGLMILAMCILEGVK